jgi:membrane fusion protein, heavy metal efflux system
MISRTKQPALRRVCSLLGALCFGALACPRSSHDDAEHHDEHHDEERSEAQHAEQDGHVRIERGMLRDLRVTTQSAESRPAGDSVVVLGELQVNEDTYAEVGSSIPARVSRVMAAAGDRVAAGQPLAELDSTEVGRARAELRSASAAAALARQTLQRRSDLARDQIVATREVEASAAELARAESQERAARDALAALGATSGSGSRFMLQAPIAGTVIDRTALLGRMVDAQRPLFVIGDLARLWLVVHAFERDALRMRPGKSATVTFPALPGQPTSGSVTRIGSRVDPASRTVDVRIVIDNPGGNLRPGMSARALVPLGDRAETVVAVPVEAVQRAREGWCVFLPTAEEGVFEIRAVGRGRELGAEVEILSGLTAGEPVVKDGAFLLAAEAAKARGGGEDEHGH